jgi:monofunctional glycosyltransferase
VKNSGLRFKPRSSARWTTFAKRIISAILLLLIGYLIIEYIFLPTGKELQAANPASSALIDARARQATKAGQPVKRQQTWQPLEKISRNLWRAVLAGEDAHFFEHHGFDTEQIAKAIAKDIAERRFARGASTISQQLAKNLYLSESKNPLRKFKEALITRRLETNLGKRRILEIYLNIIEWGDGVYGAEAAAQTHLKKSAAQLSANEAAFLAAMIPNPRTVFNPQKNPRRVARRQKIILRGMRVIKIPKKLAS